LIPLHQPFNFYPILFNLFKDVSKVLSNCFQFFVLCFSLLKTKSFDKILLFLVFIDSGIRSGTDILKCLALGAKAVLIGRPILYGLTCGGEQGVEHLINILKQELIDDMSCVGCSTIEQIHSNILYRPSSS